MDAQGRGAWGQRAWSWMVLVALTYVFWRWIAGFILPFLLAAVASALVAPWANRLERWGLPTAWAGLLALAAGLAATALGFAAVLAVLIRELGHLAAVLQQAFVVEPNAMAHWSRLWAAWQGSLGGEGGDLLRNLLGGLYALTEGTLRQMFAWAKGLPDGFLTAVVGVIAAFFLLRERHQAAGFLGRILPVGVAQRLFGLRRELVGGTVGFLKAQLGLVATTAVATSLGLLAIGSPWAVLGGLAAGLLDLIPFLGPTAVLVPWAAGLLLFGQLFRALELFAVLLGVALVRQLLEPRWVGNSTGLHPLLALFSMYVGIRLFGAAGFIVGPVSAVLLKAAAPLISPPAEAA